jgi:Macrocin-O-methyltransferase (TylF)
MSNGNNLYLDLLKRTLTNSIYEDASFGRSGPMQPIIQTMPFRAEHRAEGLDWPVVAHTMVGLQRLNNLQYCVETVLSENIPGDLIECGVWRGGCTIFMRGILAAHSDISRSVWVADSFSGLPPPNPSKYPDDAGLNFHTYKYLAVNLDTVRENFRRYDLLDERVKFLPGWFKDTLKDAAIPELAVLRVDGDLYESTMDVLSNLYARLVPGGFVIVDDYNDIPACRQAVTDFRETNKITETIVPIDWTGIYWRKGRR